VTNESWAENGGADLRHLSTPLQASIMAETMPMPIMHSPGYVGLPFVALDEAVNTG
jgi:hypothetical protein